MVTDAQEMRRQLQSAGATGGDLQSLDEVIRNLRAMGDNKSTPDPSALQQAAASAVDRMQKLEFDLRKRTDTTSNDLLVSGAEEAPVKYRPLVNDYYRALSKKAGTPAQSAAPTNAAPQNAK